MSDESPLGVTLSGGGLRAAAFGLGCLQELDAQHEVLRGEYAARFLAAVSGGSYTAAAVSLVLAGEDDGFRTGGTGRTFSAGSQEAQVLARDCDYFVRDGVPRILWQVGQLGVFGTLSLISLLLFLPTIAGMGGSSGIFVPEDDELVIALGATGLALVMSVEVV